MSQQKIKIKKCDNTYKIIMQLLSYKEYAKTMHMVTFKNIYAYIYNVYVPII